MYIVHFYNTRIYLFRKRQVNHTVNDIVSLLELYGEGKPTSECLLIGQFRSLEEKKSFALF